MRKIAKTCDGCKESVRARYRTLVDRYLCNPCWVEAQTAREPTTTELSADAATEAIRLAFEAQWEGEPPTGHGV